MLKISIASGACIRRDIPAGAAQTLLENETIIPLVFGTVPKIPAILGFFISFSHLLHTFML